MTGLFFEKKFMFLNHFDILILKINFKKYYFNIFLNKNNLKQPLFPLCYLFIFTWAKMV